MSYKLNSSGNSANILGSHLWINTETNSEYLQWLSEGNTPTPADPLPNPRITEIQQRLTQIDQESIRAMRSKQLNRGKPADDTKLTALDDEADALRVELTTTPTVV